MKIYIIINYYGHDEETEIVAIFKTYMAAKEHLKKLEVKCGILDIEEHDLID